MGLLGQPDGADVDLVQATCDFCGHRHACYVGGRPSEDRIGPATRWERHVCLGCLMRAATPGGFDACRECPIPTRGSAGTEAQEA